jgi:hypothetical protein
MPKPIVAIAVKRGGCPFSTLLEAVLEDGVCVGCPLVGQDGYRVSCGSAIAGRVLRSFSRDGDSTIECWVKVSGVPRLVSKLLDSLVASNSGGMRTQPVVKMRYGALIRVLARAKGVCSTCLSLSPPPGILPKMSIVVPGSRVEIFFVFDQKGLQEVRKMGYEVVKMEELEFSDYVLTPFQEYVLYKAYEEGRYEYPRKVRLSKLARELNVSTPTLAEVLRRAESKIMDAFIAHQMPHYYVMKVLRGAYAGCQLLAEVRRKKEDDLAEKN